MDDEPDKLLEVIYPTCGGSDDPRVRPGNDPKLGEIGCGRVLVFVAEKDFLRDRGWAYYEALKKSGYGGVVEIVESEGEDHVFHLFNPSCDNSVDLVKKEFMTLITVEDEYSRAMLGKQPCKGSRQSVPDQKFDFRALIVFKKYVHRVTACRNSFFIFVLLRFIGPIFLSSFLKMSGPSDRRLDLNAVEDVAMSPQDNIWRPSFLSSTGPLTIGDFVMKNDMIAAMVVKNLLTPKNNRLLSKRSDELAVKDSLALSVQCAGFVSSMAQLLEMCPKTNHMMILYGHFKLM
ncbi:carboxylesterase 12 [Pyrus ussuriensis x Pyrus communis]|uniref:Carboxylesterase 12 n=1 Tax=Pyrus ussuriensis x Pyrus communis TaxID=2448454 RepID=A0A5N5FNQ6_9ROSA|nr:carboxylesterase 12 [Pyrus ussuriensis x Pyrus communis]